MFKCDNCKVTSLPRVSPVMTTLATRAVEYEVEKTLELEMRAVKVSAFGTEIVKEARLCHACAGTTPPKPKLPPYPVFEEPQVPNGRVKLAALAVDALIERTKDKGKRAARDVLAGFAHLAPYKTRGGII